MHASQPEPTPRRSLWRILHDTRLPLWVSLLLILLLIAAFAWQRAALERAQAQLAAERQALAAQHAAARSSLQEQLRQGLVAQEREALARFGTVLAWAVRGELMRGNLDQIDQYFVELTRLPRVQRVLLADQSGKVLVATDRKFLGRPVTEAAPAEVLMLHQVTVQPGAQGGRLVIPVMGLNARLGTVVLDYAPAPRPQGL
ncbi:MAG: hypothetical protein NZ524_00165 [Thiobacillaceae bacterium]|nr:hypothetical protein [Thiobacillaceae bacterium]MCX7672405.1 hypothetical protein [Thiobacillaceae bacterium]MDW8323639.1 hypothetical protein [Burkholderiales bacterium]